MALSDSDYGVLSLDTLDGHEKDGQIATATRTAGIDLSGDSETARPETPSGEEQDSYNDITPSVEQHESTVGLGFDRATPVALAPIATANMRDSRAGPYDRRRRSSAFALSQYLRQHLESPPGTPSSLHSSDFPSDLDSDHDIDPSLPRTTSEPHEDVPHARDTRQRVQGRSVRSETSQSVRAQLYTSNLIMPTLRVAPASSCRRYLRFAILAPSEKTRNALADQIRAAHAQARANENESNVLELIDMTPQSSLTFDEWADSLESSYSTLQACCSKDEDAESAIGELFTEQLLFVVDVCLLVLDQDYDGVALKRLSQIANILPIAASTEVAASLSGELTSQAISSCISCDEASSVPAVTSSTDDEPVALKSVLAKLCDTLNLTRLRQELATVFMEWRHIDLVARGLRYSSAHTYIEPKSDFWARVAARQVSLAATAPPSAIHSRINSAFASESDEPSASQPHALSIKRLGRPSRRSSASKSSSRSRSEVCRFSAADPLSLSSLLRVGLSLMLSPVHSALQPIKSWSLAGLFTVATCFACGVLCGRLYV